MAKKQPKKQAKKGKSYAFWRYDLVPCVLGGEIAERRKGDIVNPKGYGRGYYFKAFKIIHGKEGKEALEQIERLRRLYNQQSQFLSNMCIAGAAQILGVSTDELRGLNS